MSSSALLRSVVSLAASALLLVACGGAGDAAGSDRAAVGADATTTTTTTSEVVVARSVPSPVDGSLRVRIDATTAPVDEAPEDVLLFGDSVSVLVAEAVAADISSRLHVDGIDCRRLDLAFVGPCGGVPRGVSVPTGVDGLRDAVAELADEGIVPGAVVVLIANNAALRPDDVAAAMDVLAEVPEVWWVTTNVEGRGWRDPNNAMIAELAAGDERVGVIDWFEASQDQDWLVDHVHPTDEGKAALGGLIAETLRCRCEP